MYTKICGLCVIEAAEKVYGDCDLDTAKKEFDKVMKETLMTSISHKDERFAEGLADLVIASANVTRFSAAGGMLTGAVVVKMITEYTDDEPEASAEMLQKVEDALVEKVEKILDVDLDEEDEDEEEPVEDEPKVKVIKASSLEEALEAVRKDIESQIKSKEKKTTKKTTKKAK